MTGFCEAPQEGSESEARARLWVRRLTLGFCFVAILLGAAEAWRFRYLMNADGVQYLDNASAYWNGDFKHAINSQWSPLYPWLIGALFRAAHPDPLQEFPLVHLLNFFIYLFSAAAFLFFLNRVLRMVAPRARVGVALIGCSAFLYCTLDFTTLAYVTPDVLVSAFAFLAAGLLLRMSAGGAGASVYVALGVVLGIGYMAKAPFLFFGLLCLAMAAVLGRKQSGAWMRCGLAALIFAMLCAPYIWALSNAKGRFTYGDSGRWNVIWMVNHVPYYHWQGGPSDNGTPIHPTRKISGDPAIYEFATPVGGTYPPWYDPIYWTEGAKIAFRPADFAHALLVQIQLYGWLVHHRQLALVFALATLFLLAPDKRKVFATIGKFWPALLFGIAPFAMYAMVHADGRFFPAFFVMLWTSLAAGLLMSLEGEIEARVPLAIAAVAAALMLVEAITVSFAPVPEPRDYEVAQATQALGLKPGDPVAIVTGDFDYSWARLAGVHVILEVDFNGKDKPSQWEKAKPILAGQGAAMVVSPGIPGVVDQPGWQQLGSTGIFAYRLR
ncbi:MAG TPA: hypothetical protein VKT81_26265 [Bryobacteraceae bacterium]|nr:hypothetical protein [Bryobacteraceae bacterium]